MDWLTERGWKMLYGKSVESKTDVDYLLIRPVDLFRKVRMASQEELEKMLKELEIEQKKATTLDVLDYLRDVKALVKGRLAYFGKSNPDAELITMRETAEAMLLDAYAGEPAVTMWLDAKGFTTEDLESEIARLTRALEGRRVPRPMIDVMKMREEVAEKRIALGKAVIIESVLEQALRGEKWALEKMLTLGYTRVEDLEAEANRLRKEMADPQVQERLERRFYVIEQGIPSREEALARVRVLRREHPEQIYRIEYNPEFYDYEITKMDRLSRIVSDPNEVVKYKIQPLILRNHTIENIVSLARFVQTEGSIGCSIKARKWVPVVAIGMGVEEPLSFTARLVDVPVRHRRVDQAWMWMADTLKAFSVLKTIEPYLMADKWEQARYILNIGRMLPDTEYRPMYIGLVQRRFRPVFLHPEYVDFPVKYAVVVHKGETLPTPLRRAFPIRFTPEGRPILWYDGIIRDP